MVMDCLCGSGTNDVAAIKLGRNFIGTDIDSSALEVSRARRLAQVGILNGLKQE